MKILAFVDTHGNMAILNKIVEKAEKEKPHLLICAGDLSNWGQNLKSLLSKINNINIPTLIIHGNHEAEDEMKKLCSSFKSIIFLHKSSYKINNYVFFGYGGGGFEKIDKELEKIITNFKKTIKREYKVIIITHAPPYNTKLDRLNHLGHRGSKSIRKAIEEIQPVLNICGHLHENAGNIDKIDKTKIINPGPSAIIEI